MDNLPAWRLCGSGTSLVGGKSEVLRSSIRRRTAARSGTVLGGSRTDQTLISRTEGRQYVSNTLLTRCLKEPSFTSALAPRRGRTILRLEMPMLLVRPYLSKTLFRDGTGLGALARQSLNFNGSPRLLPWGRGALGVIATNHQG